MNTPFYTFWITYCKNIGNRKAHFFVILTCFFIVSCSSIVESPVVATEQIPETVESGPTSQPESFPEDNGCELPYTESSIWNVSIDWSVAQIHPDSKKMMDAFWSGTPWIGSDASQYAPNIYFVDETTPLVSVKLRKNRFRDAFNDIEIKYGEPASTVWMPIPPEAQPAPGTDGQVVVINTDTGEEWGLRVGAKDLFGNWLADGAYRYSIRNSGVPPLGFAQRGAGIGNFSGIIRPCEVERGSIDHAVTLAYDFPCAPDICRANGWPEVIPPFTKTDGKGMSKYDIPEGARVIIHPEITMDEIISACAEIKGCIVWVVAMQKFGGFVVDRSDHPKTIPEGNATANWDPMIWSKDMLRNIPLEWYDVIDWNYPVTTIQ